MESLPQVIPLHSTFSKPMNRWQVSKVQLGAKVVAILCCTPKNQTVSHSQDINIVALNCGGESKMLKYIIRLPRLPTLRDLVASTLIWNGQWPDRALKCLRLPSPYSLANLLLLPPMPHPSERICLAENGSKPKSCG